jgi:Glycosyl hydrolase family 20, catalytic domain
MRTVLLCGIASVSLLMMCSAARAEPAKEVRRIVGFHIDMNMAQYRADYLKRWLTELASRGYNTIIWELEDGVEWQTVPEARQPDALSKDEFRGVLNHARGLGLENIPLLQTLGHAEYVLQHERYRHLRANPDDIRQYDPLHPEVVPLLRAWIEEYLDLFGEVRYFHIGADEARQLDFVQRSSRNVDGLSVSQIFMRHVNAVSQPLLDKGITPIIWADMVLHHHEAIDELSREVMLFDWMYDVWRGNGKVFIWGGNRGLRTRDQLTPGDLELFGKYLFPDRDGPGVQPETFYTADFLADKGFPVVTCPASSSYGDNVFSPRLERHLRNTWDSAVKGLSAPRLRGTVLTSWSVHLHPWELQHAHIAAVGYLSQHPGTTMDGFRAWYVKETFGVQDDRFWRAGELLSGPCLFTYTRSLGFGKACLPVAEDHVGTTIRKIKADGRLEDEINNARQRRREYERSLELFTGLRQEALRGDHYLAVWDLAARNLINRAQAAELLLSSHTDSFDRAAHRDRARDILRRMRSLRAEYEALYTTMIRPARRGLMIGYMFDAVETELARLAGP